MWSHAFSAKERGAYDAIPELSFGLMYHGITYADQAHGEDFKNKMTVNFWYPVMKYGVLEFPEPEDARHTKSYAKCP